MFNIIKRISLFAIIIFIASSISNAQEDKHGTHNGDKKSDEPVGIKMNDGMLYGKDYDPSMKVVEFGDLISSSSENNNKLVLVRGTVAEVCQAMGCWMTMTDGSVTARVKTGHEYLLPKDIAGQNAVVIGTFKMTEISEADARHYNDETKNPKVKTEDIIGTQKVYEIDAMGIKILNSVSEPSKN